jgi:hypothetical protein
MTDPSRSEVKANMLLPPESVAENFDTRQQHLQDCVGVSPTRMAALNARIFIA